MRPTISLATVATDLRQVCGELNRLEHSRWICDRRILLSHKFLTLQQNMFNNIETVCCRKAATLPRRLGQPRPASPPNFSNYSLLLPPPSFLRSPPSFSDAHRHLQQQPPVGPLSSFLALSLYLSLSLSISLHAAGATSSTASLPELGR